MLANVPAMYNGNNGIITVDSVAVTISWKSLKNLKSTSPFPWFLRYDIPRPIINANTIAAVTSTIGSSGIENIALSCPALGSPILSATADVMNLGNNVDATVNAKVPAIKVDP